MSNATPTIPNSENSTQLTHNNTHASSNNNEEIMIKSETENEAEAQVGSEAVTEEENNSVENSMFVREEFYLSPNELLGAIPSISTLHGIHKALKDRNIPTIADKRNKKIPSDSVRSFFQGRGYAYPKLNLNFHIIKGGVGKTSLALAVAVRATMYGARVLCVDFDQQGNLTTGLGVNGRNRPVWLHLFRGDINGSPISITDAIVPITKTLHLIPSSMNNSRLDSEFSSGRKINVASHVRDMLAPIRDFYDLVIFDCPPSLNHVTSAVTCASDLVIMPINADDYSMDALDSTVEEILEIKDNFKVKTEFKILWNKYDQREKLAVQYLHELASKPSLRDRVLPVVIRTDTAIKNALNEGLSIFEVKPRPGVCEDVDILAKEILGLKLWAESSANLTARQ